MGAERVIRVFPRRTSMTPMDAMAFVGDPPLGLWRPEADEVHVSVTFTWDIAEGERLARAWGRYYPTVRIGGPALDDPCEGFVPGQYIKHGATFTSRGCNHHCPWCLVWRREGPLRLLPIVPGWIIQDNNILATPRSHQEKVYAMLRTQRRAAVFSGGLEAARIDDWVAGQFRELRIGTVFLAADTKGSLPALCRAVGRLRFLGRSKLRCYVLIAYKDETVSQAAERLEAVWDAGCLPFAQLYRAPDGKKARYSKEWRDLARAWSRPAATKAIHKQHGQDKQGMRILHGENETERRQL